MKLAERKEKGTHVFLAYFHWTKISGREKLFKIGCSETLM